MSIKGARFEVVDMDDILTPKRKAIKAAKGYYLAVYDHGIPDSLLRVALAAGFMPRTARIRTRQVSILVNGDGGVLTQLGAWDMDERFGWKFEARAVFPDDPDVRELCAQFPVKPQEALQQ